MISDSQSLLPVLENCSRETIVAFDTEFIRESTFFPSLEVIQIATRRDAYLIDAKRVLKDARCAEALRIFFSNKQILKVAHAAIGDQECLHYSLKQVAIPCFDTAVGASLLGMGDNVGLGNLLSQTLGVKIKKGHARTDWSVRPLPAHLIEYALADVRHLVVMGEHLLSELEKKGRKDWALSISGELGARECFETPPEEAAARLARGNRLEPREYAALIELCKWREWQIRHSNLPRKWVAEDRTLLDLARVRPKDMKHLESFRGISKGNQKLWGPAIIDAIHKSEGALLHDLPSIPKSIVPTSSESEVLNLLSCYIKILSDRLGIAPRHLMQAASMMRLLRMWDEQKLGDVSESEALETLKAAEIFGGFAAKEIGSSVLAFLRGKISLSVDAKQMSVIERS